MATKGVAMGQAIAVRTDNTAGEVRRFAKQAKDVAQARRLLAIAAVLQGASRAHAAKIGGMDRQTLRDWVHRLNGQGADGLVNIPSPGVPPKQCHAPGVSRQDRGGRSNPGCPWRGAV
jgi:Helix-turn-helix domain